MIFKWTSKNKAAPEAADATPAPADSPAAPPHSEASASTGTAASPSASASQMARELFEKVVPFKSRAPAAEGEVASHAELDDLQAALRHSGGLGQEAALETLRFGAMISGNDYNMVVAVPRGVDGASLVRETLRSVFKRRSSSDPALTDWTYVPRLTGVAGWVALPLPAQRAAAFKRLLGRALQDLREALPETLHSESYQLRRLAIDDMHGQEADGALSDLIQRAAVKNVAVLRLPQGFSVAPMHDGKVVRPEVLKQLPETMRREVETRVRGFQAELETLLARVPHLDRARRSELRDLHDDIVAKAATLAFADVREEFSDVPAAIQRIEAMMADLRAHATEVLAYAAEASAEIWRRYDVVVMQDISEGPPVIDLADARAETLIGAWQDGRSAPSPGALHDANGGALLLSADGLLHDLDAREILLRTLQSQDIRPVTAPRLYDPIPFNAKVVIIGDPDTCERLQAADVRFRRTFKLEIALNDAMARTNESEVEFADALQGLVQRHKTKPLEASGLAALIDEATRTAGQDKVLSLALEDTGDLLREASAWADLAGDTSIEARHVSRAQKARDDRKAGRVRQSSPTAPSGKVAKAFGS